MAPSSCCSLVWGDSREACGAGSAWTWHHYWENVSWHSWQTAPRADTADGGRVSWQRLTYYTYKGICKEPATLEWTHGKYSTNIWCWSNKPLHKNMAKWEESGPWPVVLPLGQNLPHLGDNFSAEKLCTAMVRGTQGWICLFWVSAGWPWASPLNVLCIGFDICCYGIILALAFSLRIKWVKILCSCENST